MALETLKNVKEIGGYPVVTLDEYKEKLETMHPLQFDDWERNLPIILDHDRNSLNFKFQSAPVKEVGVNGCQVDTLIAAAKLILEGLDEALPFSSNHRAIVHLELALKYLEERRKDREARGVEGTSNA